MSYIKRIVCLANSRKLSGTCVAGLEVTGVQVGGWIRPVSSRLHGEISDYDQTLENGARPTLLDIVEIHMIEPRPDGCQSENHLIDDSLYWQIMGRFPKQRLLQYCTAPNPLWENGLRSTNGTNDRIPERRAASLPSSLVLVEPTQLTIVVAQGHKGRRQVRAVFGVAGEVYNLGVTDPAIEGQYRSLAEGYYT